MAKDILSQIVERRKADIERLGVSLGFEIPAERKRPLHPFLQEKGVILEVKRASPSKGDIAPDLDAAKTALEYQRAGAAAISVLTESNWFKGNLDDLKSVCASVDVAVLRKDFLIFPDEIDAAYKCGADAVLLIARVLDEASLRSMLSRCASLGVSAFVELRLEEDLEKLSAAVLFLKEQNQKIPAIVCGVNARDLKDFSIDLLSPSGFLERIQAAMGKGFPVVFESGIRTAEAAAFAGSLGFAGLLLGEAAARDSSASKRLVSSFKGAGATQNALAWASFAKEARDRRASGARPFVKICGITNKDDAFAAFDLGADFLGFVLSAASPRKADESAVREIRSAFTERRPRFVGVVTEIKSAEGEAALRLLKEGVLDFIQLHGARAAAEFFSDAENRSLAHYCAANVGSEEDLEAVQNFLNLGEPRVLIDAKAGAHLGGTGKAVSESLVKAAAKKAPLWLAGGLGADNVLDAIKNYEPELIDASSALEKAPGKKDSEKLREFFSELEKIGARV